VASQKFTVPAATGVEPAVTVAVSVNAVPKGAEIAGLPPEVTASFVVDAAIEGSV
jgi:hypothetical protein